MPRIYTLNDIGNSDGSKLGSPPSNRYPPSRLELEEQLKKDREKFIRSAKQLITKYHVLDKKNKCMQNDLDRSHEENERMQNSMKQITPLTMQQNDLINKLGSKITSERKSHLESQRELEAKYSAEIKTLKRELTLAQKASFNDKIQIISLETKIRELEGKLGDIELERTYHDWDVKGGVVEESVQMPKLPDWLHDNLRSIVCELGLEDKVMELDKKLAKEDILEVLQKVISEKDHHLQDANARLEKALSEKDFLLQETNTRLAEQILKTSSESKVLGGASGLEKDNGITSPKTTSDSPYNLFFQQYGIIIIIVLLVIFIIWRIFSHRYSSNPPYNEEKNIPNYKIPLNRNQSYGFPIRYAEEPKDRITSYETSSFGYG
jgi:hypothetical protein